MISLLIQIPLDRSLDATFEHLVRTAESFLATLGEVHRADVAAYARAGRGHETERLRQVTLEVDAELPDEDRVARANSLERVLKTMCEATAIPGDKVRVFARASTPQDISAGAMPD